MILNFQLTVCLLVLCLTNLNQIRAQGFSVRDLYKTGYYLYAKAEGDNYLPNDVFKFTLNETISDNGSLCTDYFHDGKLFKKECFDSVSYNVTKADTAFHSFRLDQKEQFSLFFGTSRSIVRMDPEETGLPPNVFVFRESNPESRLLILLRLDYYLAEIEQNTNDVWRLLAGKAMHELNKEPVLLQRSKPADIQFLEGDSLQLLIADEIMNPELGNITYNPVSVLTYAYERDTIIENTYAKLMSCKKLILSNGVVEKLNPVVLRREDSGIFFNEMAFIPDTGIAPGFMLTEWNPDFITNPLRPFDDPDGFYIMVNYLRPYLIGNEPHYAFRQWTSYNFVQLSYLPEFPIFWYEKDGFAMQPIFVRKNGISLGNQIKRVLPQSKAYFDEFSQTDMELRCLLQINESSNISLYIMDANDSVVQTIIDNEKISKGSLLKSIPKSPEIKGKQVTFKLLVHNKKNPEQSQHSVFVKD